MSDQLKQKNTNLVWLAFFSLLMSGLFSIAGAPFLRVFFVATRSRVFWTTAVLFVGMLFVLGITNYKVSETAVYVGAIWMTLGTYSELEKRGINWKASGLNSLISGLLFSTAGYFLVLKNFENIQALSAITEPLREALKKAFPNDDISLNGLESTALPGIIMASLFLTLAAGIVFESKVSRLLKIKRERVASGVRWLEFRLPDAAIWTILISTFFFAQLGLFELPELLITACGNLLLVAVVILFFQGVTIIEFMLRYYRFGSFTRVMTYLLIVLQLAPFLVLLGFVDYWADFRRLIRKKQKQTI